MRVHSSKFLFPLARVAGQGDQAGSSEAVSVRSLAAGSAGSAACPKSTLREAGVRDGDTVDAVVQGAALAATECAFACYVEGGGVVIFGCQGIEADSADHSQVREQLTRVQQIKAIQSAFAAIREDGLVVTWGEPNGGGDSSEVQAQLTRVQQIQSTDSAFAALRDDGTVVTWGDRHDGGDSRQVQEQLTRVRQIQATQDAFAALRYDGTVVTWGDRLDGASRQVQEQLTQVQQIQATCAAFAAVRRDGSVVTWGDRDCGGDSSRVQDQLTSVKQIQATQLAFCCNTRRWLGGDMGRARGWRQQPCVEADTCPASSFNRIRFRCSSFQWHRGDWWP